MRLHYTLLFVILTVILTAQSTKWEAGLMLGGVSYQGDLVKGILPDFNEIGNEYSFFLNRRLNRSFSGRFQLAYASYSGEDDYGFRGYAFTGQILQVATILEWEPFSSYADTYFSARTRKWSPYLFTGIGGAYLDVTPDFPFSEEEELSLKIKADINEADNRLRPIVPVGIGMKVALSTRYELIGELGTQSTFTDQLDAVSQSANPDANDWLAFGRIGILVRFLPKDSDKDGIADEIDACPTIKGMKTAQGCPDSDQDGVEDLEDICPEEYGYAHLNGCPDIDKDGIADAQDRCPFQKGDKSALGCPDQDKDGLADPDDDCIYLPGLAAMNGCPVLDADADGELADEEKICLPSPATRELTIIEAHYIIPISILNSLIFHIPTGKSISPEGEFDFQY